MIKLYRVCSGFIFISVANITMYGNTLNIEFYHYIFYFALYFLCTSVIENKLLQVIYCEIRGKTYFQRQNRRPTSMITNQTNSLSDTDNN